MTCFVFAFFPQTMLQHKSQASMYRHARNAIGEDTLFFRKTHCLSRRHIMFPRDTLCFEGGPQELYRWIDFKKGGAPPHFIQRSSIWQFTKMGLAPPILYSALNENGLGPHELYV